MRRDAWNAVWRLAGLVGWSRSEVMESTCRELMIANEARQIAEYDRSSVQASLIHNLSIIVASMSSKKKPEPVSMFDYHPYRQKPASNTILTPETLKSWGEAFMKAGKCRNRSKKNGVPASS